MIRLEGPTLPAETQGQIMPALYGARHLDVPFFPLQVSYSVTLAEACGVEATSGAQVIRISAPDLQETIDRLTPGLPTVAQVDQEWMLVLGFPSGTTMSVTRAYGGTTAAEHEAGATIVFLETREIWVGPWNPPGLRYPDDALIQLRIDGNSATPPCTFRLQDTRIVDGQRYITAEFDTSRYFSAIPPKELAAPPIIIPSGIMGISPNIPQPAPALRTFGSGSSGGSGGFGGLSSGGGFFSGSVGFHGFGGIVPAPAAPEPALGAFPPLGPTPRAALTSGPISIVGQTVGRVTADLRGLLDTPAGRYSGTPEAPLIEPVPITRARMEILFGQSNLHLPSWTATRAAHAAMELTWRVRDYGEDFEPFRQATGFCGVAILWLDDDGRWRYTMEDGRQTPVATLTAREIVGSISLGMIPPSATRLGVTWGQGRQGGAFTLDSPDMIKRHGVIARRTLSLPYAVSESVARKVARPWALKWDRPKSVGPVAVVPAMAGLTRADSVMIDTPLLEVYGRRVVPWEIRATTDRVTTGQRVLRVVEGRAPALGAPLSGTLEHETALMGAPLTGTLQPAIFAPLSGSLEGGPYWGDGYFGPGYFGPGYWS